MKQWLTKFEGKAAEVWCWGIKWYDIFTRLENSSGIFQGQ